MFVYIMYIYTVYKIFKKSYQEGVFEFFNPVSQLVQKFEPTKNLSGQYFYIYPNRAYFRYGKLSCRFYTFCVFLGGGVVYFENQSF